MLALSCYTVNIHLEKWLMRCDTKRAIWWDLYNKNISKFGINHVSTIFRTLQVKKRQSKKQTFFSFCKINATDFGTKNEISHKLIYHYMTSNGYIIMIIVDSCIIWFHLDCITQLKKSYYIATNVSSRKGATTFGDLPDCLFSFHNHEDVIKWKHFPRYWPFVRGIHRSRWIPRTKASDAELWCVLSSASE